MATALTLKNVFRYMGDQPRIDPERDLEITVLARVKDPAVNLCDPRTKSVSVTLLNLAGDPLRDVDVDASDLSDLPQKQRKIVQKAWGQTTGIGKAIVDFLQVDDGAVRELRLAIAGSDRYEASSWFERDRASLTLRDKLVGAQVITLWDTDVHDAIDSGYLTAPRHPRPTDKAWVEPLLAYAHGTGQLAAFDLGPKALARQSSPGM